ncbi:hypothetical protein M2319_003356 [Rhodobium gokarnense]|uniref:Uncharacterized protein n=1 Tax=Rhodobium gokarnense TaxID=364296 RepID=A0ABT3HF49_9HYPH|nr:hypothetical protein [Rhodobium gokarnense]
MGPQFRAEGPTAARGGGRVGRLSAMLSSGTGVRTGAMRAAVRTARGAVPPGFISTKTD